MDTTVLITEVVMNNELLCDDPKRMAKNLVRCACREVCIGCSYEEYAVWCENTGYDDTCIDKMMRECAVMLNRQQAPIIKSLRKRDIMERSHYVAKTEEREP